MTANRPVFWRSTALPYLEARGVEDARHARYDRHSHATLSIGAILRGRSRCEAGGRQRELAAGDVVVVHPEEVHACNPAPGAPWAYRMLYVDPTWLADLAEAPDFQPLARVVSTDPALFDGLVRLYDRLRDPAAEGLAKEEAAATVFGAVLHRLGPGRAPLPETGGALRRAADFISDHCAEPLRLAEISREAGLSPSHCVRAFRRAFGMTPHAYLIDRRIRRGQALLKQGKPIVEVALATGFADQAHFQRTFKRLVAATPKQYAA